MLRFKQFVGNGDDLELAVNGWLARFEPDITQMVQTAREDGTVVISFLFEESFRAQELRMDEERGMPADLRAAVPASTIPDQPLTVPIEPGSEVNRPS